MDFSREIHFFALKKSFAPELTKLLLQKSQLLWRNPIFETKKSLFLEKANFKGQKFQFLRRRRNQYTHF